MENATSKSLSRENNLLHFGVVSYNMRKQYLNITWSCLNYLIFSLFILFGRNGHSHEPNAYIISTFVFLSHLNLIYLPVYITFINIGA